MESQTQKRLIQYLKKRGCYVIKTRPGPGVPVGCPDVVALFEGFWAAFEVKRSISAPYRPLQKETLEKLSKWSYARMVCPENFDEVVAELDAIL